MTLQDTQSPDFKAMGHDTPFDDLWVLDFCAKRCKAFFDRDPEIVEVGSWAGLTTLALCTPEGLVHAVDHWKGNPDDRVGKLADEYGSEAVFSAFCKNMGSRLFRTVFPHRGHSMSYAGVWPRLVDMVFIDADHRYEHVKADADSWVMHVRHRGIIAFHDYGIFQGVTNFVDRSRRRGHINHIDVTDFNNDRGTVAWFHVIRPGLPSPKD